MRLAHGLVRSSIISSIAQAATHYLNPTLPKDGLFMKLSLLFLIFSAAPLIHADVLDDKADAGGQLLYKWGKTIEEQAAVKGRFSCSDVPGYPNHCTPQESALHQKAESLYKQAEALAPAKTGLNFTKDQMSLSTDDLMWELIDRRQHQLESKEELENCRKYVVKASSCTKEQTDVDFYNQTYAEAKANLIRKAGADALSEKIHEPATLAEIKGRTVSFAKGSDFAVTDKGDTDFTEYQALGNCMATVKFTDFKSYAGMYTGEEASPSWTVGNYLPSYSIDSHLEGATKMCAALDGQKTQAACYNSLRQGISYHVPDSVVLSATDGTSRMTIYSSDETKNDKGVFDCVKAENFKGLEGSPVKQVAGDTNSPAAR